MNTNLSTREKAFICIIVIAVLCTIFYMFLLKPQLESISSMETTLSDKQNEVSKYRNFDETIENTNNEVNNAKENVKISMKDWHDTLIQHEIITDLQNKISVSKLYDTNITFANFQQSNIISAGDLVSDEKIPTIAESLAMAYLCLMQDSNAKSDIAAANSAPSASPAASAAPASSGAPASGDMVLNPDTKSAPELPDVPPELTVSFEAFKNSLNNLSDEERRSEVQKIMAKSNTNIEKLDISISFQDSSYQSILSFINQINNDNPKIYITSITYSDSTQSYISKLNALINEEESQETLKNIFSNVYPSAETMRSQINPKAALKLADDSRVYTGTIVISYFSLVKMQLDSIDNMLVIPENPEAAQQQDTESAKL